MDVLKSLSCNSPTDSSTKWHQLTDFSFELWFSWFFVWWVFFQLYLGYFICCIRRLSFTDLLLLHGVPLFSMPVHHGSNGKFDFWNCLGVLFCSLGLPGAVGALSGPACVAKGWKGFSRPACRESLAGRWMWRESFSWFPLRPFPPCCSGISGQVRRNFRKRDKEASQTRQLVAAGFLLSSCLSTLVSLWRKVDSSGLMKEEVLLQLIIFGGSLSWLSLMMVLCSPLVRRTLSIRGRNELTWVDF